MKNNSTTRKNRKDGLTVTTEIHVRWVKHVRFPTGKRFWKIITQVLLFFALTSSAAVLAPAAAHGGSGTSQSIHLLVP